MAASSRQAESWPSFWLSIVLSHQCWKYGFTDRADWREDQLSPGKPAAWYDLPLAHCCCHQCRVGWAVCLDISQDSKGIQCTRYNIRKNCPDDLCTQSDLGLFRKIYKRKKYTHSEILSLNRLAKWSPCSNNLVKSLHLLLSNLCLPLSVTLEGASVMGHKENDSGLRVGKSIWLFRGTSEILSGGRVDLFFLPISSAMHSNW